MIFVHRFLRNYKNTEVHYALSNPFKNTHIPLIIMQEYFVNFLISHYRTLILLCEKSRAILLVPVGLMAGRQAVRRNTGRLKRPL